MLAAASQPAPGQSQATDALGTIGQYGAIGAICVLAIIALYLSIKGWLKEKDNRLSDQQAATTVLEKNNEALKNLTIEMKEFAAQQQIEAVRSNDAVKAVMKAQKDELTEMKLALGQLKDEQVRLGSQLQQRGSS